MLVKKLPTENSIVVIGAAVLALALCIWQVGLIKAATYYFVAGLSVIVSWQELQNLLQSLPKTVTLSFNALLDAQFIGTAVLILSCGISLLSLLAHDLAARGRDAAWRLHVSSIVGFAILVTLMSVLFLELFAEVFLSGQSIKPFPKDAIGAEQYLSALAFLPWGILLTLAIWVCVELLSSGSEERSG